MKNCEKYKTADERSEAFHKFCSDNTTEFGMCDPWCKLFDTINDTNGYCTHCEFYWLDMEAQANTGEKKK